MAARGASARADMPPELVAKQPALSAATKRPSAADRLAAEVEAEEFTRDDGAILVPLVTERGDANIWVPPMRRWRSSARAALMTRDDSFTWAMSVLAPEDAITWTRLDPYPDEAEAFFTEWGRRSGQALGESAASRRL